MSLLIAMIIALFIVFFWRIAIRLIIVAVLLLLVLGVVDALHSRGTPSVPGAIGQRAATRIESSLSRQ